MGCGASRTESHPSVRDAYGDRGESKTKPTKIVKVENGVQKKNKPVNKLLNFTYIKAKINSIGIRALVEEVSDARKADPNNTDLEKLGLALQLSQDALKYDPKQLPAQLLSRITAPTDGIVSLLEQCRACDDLYLLPSQELLLHSGGQLVHIVSEHNARMYCMAMTADGKYVITCSEDDTMVITNVMEGRRERKILQIGGLPDEVHLCCDEKLVVTGTNKHVIAHTLETGTEEWTLSTKDNLNVYPPVMDCVGPHQDTLVIFDEMKVVFFEASTGNEVETLEMPKKPMINFDCYVPRPCSNDKYVVATDTDCNYLILVDYIERKIVNVKKQTYPATAPSECCNTEALAITGCAGNEQYVIYSSGVNGNIFFLDVPNLDVVKVFKDEENLNYSYHFNLTKDEKYLYFPTKSDGVCVWDVHNAQMCTILPEAKELTDVLTVDMKTFVTICEDRNVRIWDVNQGQEEQTSGFDFQDREVITFDKGKEVVAQVQSGKGEADFHKPKGGNNKKEKKSDVEFGELITMDSPRYMLVKIKINDTSFLQVYDVATNIVVRSMQLPKDVAVTYLKGSQVLMEFRNRLTLVDMDKMETITKFQGKIYENLVFDDILISGGKELLTVTKSGHHLKVYDMQTGKATEVIKQEFTEEEDEENGLSTLDDFVINKNCSVGVAQGEEELIVFDLVNRKMKDKLTPTKLGNDCLTMDTELFTITDDGHYLLFSGMLPVDPDKWPRYQDCIVVYDLHAGSIARRILDMQAALKYHAEQNEQSLSIDNMRLLDNRTIIAAYDDFLIRVYDMNTGEVLHRLEGHWHIPALIVREDCPVFLSHVDNREENSIRMWSKSDFTLLASFTSEITLRNVYLLPGCSHQFVACPGEGNVDAPIIFSVHGKKKEALLGKQSPLASYPELYKGKKSDGEVSLTPADNADFGDDLDSESDAESDTCAEDEDDDDENEDDDDDDQIAEDEDDDDENEDDDDDEPSGPCK